VIFLKGALYGITPISNRAPHDEGSIFRIAPKNGIWSEEVLHHFVMSEGYQPGVGLVADGAGNLYGTNAGGGSGNCPQGCGTVFELSPPTAPGNPWRETTLYNFTKGMDGNGPQCLAGSR
jgi:hypothetical protein